MQIEPTQNHRRQPSLTPMIDVVFLLLVFFMLASRFGMDNAIPIPLASSAGEYKGVPRLIDILPNTVLLNGINVEQDALSAAVEALTETKTDTIVLRARDGADLQRIVDISVLLKDAEFQNVVLVE